MLRRLLLTTLAAAALALAAAAPAWAHNSLDSSTPAEGATVATQLTEMQWVFTKDVPLETLTVTLTDPSGVRTELAASRHGATAKEVVTPLPSLADGAYSVRWRLVGPDGHAITGRVRFTLAVAASASTAPAAPTTVLAGDAGVTPTTAPVPTSEVGGDDPGWSTPNWVRWLLRYASYLAIMIVAGVTVTEELVLRRPGPRRFRHLVSRALAGVGLIALLQLFVLAGDIAGAAPWSAFTSLGLAAENPTGTALVVRMVLAFAAWLLVVRERPNSPDVYQGVVVLLAIGLLATWSFSGHPRSMRWPWIGVPTDVLHHGAAAAWIGGLSIVGIHALRAPTNDDPAELARRFSRVAGWSVAVIVATGVVQTLHLVGGPGALFSTTHGRLVLVKVVLLAGMLWLADRNRRLVHARFQPGEVAGHDGSAGRDVAMLRQAMRREFAIGVVILGVTASLVARPPATSDEGAASRPAQLDELVLHACRNAPGF